MSTPAYIPAHPKAKPDDLTTWSTGDIEGYEHILETQGAALLAARAANAEHRVVFGHHSDGTTISGTLVDLHQRITAAYNVRPELHERPRAAA